MRRTRSSALSPDLGPADLTGGNCPEEKRQLRNRKTLLGSESDRQPLLGKNTDCLMQSEIHSGWNLNQGRNGPAAASTPLTGSSQKWTASPRSNEHSVAAGSRTMTTSDSKYNLRRGRIFTVNSKGVQDYGRALKNYYNTLFADDTNNTETTLKFDTVLATHGHRVGLLLAGEATDLPNDHYLVHNDHSTLANNARHVEDLRSDIFFEDNAAHTENLFFLFKKPKGKSTDIVRDDASAETTGVLRSCLRNRDLSYEKLSEQNTNQTESFDYVLRNDGCLLRRKQSFVEKLTQGLHSMLGSKRKDVPIYSPTRYSDGIASATKRRVSFLEPENVTTQEVGLCEETDLKEDASSCSRMEPSSEELSSENEKKKSSLWTLPTCLVLSIYLWVRMMLDAWSDPETFGHLDFLHLFRNESSDCDK